MMSLRLTYLSVTPDKMEELRDRWNSTVLTDVRNTPGHHSSHFMEDMVDRTKAIGWIVWDEPEIAEQYEQGEAFRSHVKLVEDLLTGAPYIRHYHFLKQSGS